MKDLFTVRLLYRFPSGSELAVWTNPSVRGGEEKRGTVGCCFCDLPGVASQIPFFPGISPLVSTLPTASRQLQARS
jgi:hypothetical protein